MALWMVRGGRYGQQEELALDNSITCIGFSEVADLSSSKNYELVVEVVREAYPDASKGRAQNHAAQLHAFVNRIQEGDLIAMPLKTRRQIALGKATGPYNYRTDLGHVHHCRAIEWIRPNVPRKEFAQDLLYSLGAFMTVCQIQRNDAEVRVRAILTGESDPGFALPGKETAPTVKETEAQIDIEQLVHDQIINLLETHFKGHDLARLTATVLQAEGYKTKVSSPGPDGGVDILAGKGALGFEGLTLCVQVKSSQSPVDVNVLRALQGSMSTFKADQGLLVSWGGFTKPVTQEARLSYFSVRLWDADDLLNAVLRNYDRLPEEIQSELPLKRTWTLVLEE
ncbi:restriction endonuclease [archaeon]|nr:MAG: restriction endonuclease [archaeon]